MESLSRYYKVLKDRNAYLKEKSMDLAYLEVLTRQMIAYQLDLIRLKRGFIESLNRKIEHVYQHLSLSTDTVSIQYLGPVESSEDMKGLLEAKYHRSLERDKVFKMTHVGVHRDDLDFRIDGQVVQNVASQGQKRMFVIALKCALLEVIEEISGEKPILLLDDVFSELDSKRKKALYEILHQSTQTLITTTDVEDVALWLQDRVSIYEVHQGQVSERSSVHE
jgi:DNA replication and repair protein RecF